MKSVIALRILEDNMRLIKIQWPFVPHPPSPGAIGVVSRRRLARFYFNLVELLMVIGIIFVVMALLLPALAKTREKGKYANWLEYSNHATANLNLVIFYDLQEGDGDTLENRALGPEEYPNFIPTHFAGDIQNAYWITGRWSGKGALYFNGSAWVESSDLPPPLPGADAEQSVLWWHKISSVDNNTQTIFDFSSSDGTSAVQGGFRNGKISVWNSDGDILVQNSDSPILDQWQQCCYTLTVNGSDYTHRLYVNAKLVDTQNTAPQTDVPDQFWLGRQSGAGDFYEGYLDQIMVFNRVLPESEIVDDYEAGKP
jgi:type II secretory pathway pseudopilin PulG